ncbi:hypothetical protein H2204_012227 [Knufia peltigerae]|uniref:Polyketide synthase n=1 Tax=Knufia peltigerae TaxID=1002370 RepID=A0AA38XSP8_9EURO|nr:hypothetical protein H2204_012227 [Knufia peltigerae]
MAGSISFFGDGSLPLHPTFSQILQARTQRSLLSVFLHKARLALQDEISQVPIPDRKGMPDLAELECLIPNPAEKQPRDHQCLAPAMLVIIQLGQFISWYENHPEEPYPGPESSFVVGLCVGQLSAVAVSLARSLVELLPLAIESVRLAFRTGLTATMVRDELEQGESSETWAVQSSRALGLGEDNLLDTIHKEEGIPERKRSYISASFGKAFTLQGPPSTLDKIGHWLSSNRKSLPPNSYQRLPIYTPYHAPHLYSEEDIKRILNFPDTDDSKYDHTPWETTKLPLVSPVTGKYYQANSTRHLLQLVMHDVLKAPIEWSNVTAGCADHVAALQHGEWVVRAYGPTLAAGSLVATLTKGAQVNAILDGASAAKGASYCGVPTNEPIAIVGMAGRFPEAASHDELWNVLEKGMDCAKVIPADRFDKDLYVKNDGAARNPAGTLYGCFIKEPGLFDARFFNMSPREAEQTDPQQRLALVTAYEALEMSGFVPNRTPSTQLDRIGTYYGQTGDDYREWNASQDVQTYYISGNDRAFGPGRINHHFKFGGPSMSIDTACSSSAVALNTACTALWANDCDTAVVGGMTLFTSADTFCGLSRGHFLNHTGNCKTFDDAADGYCRGEAVATVVVKRLSDAKADNDNVLAVILAAGTNYSAASSSITHPHGPTQETLYRRLLNDAGLHPFDVDYVEMHGTGTQAGDAAEMSSVSNVFAPASPARPREHPLWLGAVKSNIAHGESASGVTALIKSLLVLREQTIPPHVGIKSGNMNHTFPDLQQRNIKIALGGPEAFPCKQARRRRFMVNNFGAAGGNTALLLEEAPLRVTNVGMDPRADHIVAISAKTPKSMKGNARSLLAYLEKHPETSLSDVSYTTTARRSHFTQRLSLMASSISQLKSRLAQVLDTDPTKTGKPSNIIFTFTGQGSLYVPLAKELFDSSRQFKSDILRFHQICLDYGFPSFMPVIESENGDMEGLSPAQTQLAIASVQMSLFRLWTTWGVVPAAVVGHSLGEYAALFAARVLSANDTLYLVGKRALLLETMCSQGTHCMLSAHADLASLKKHLGNLLNDLEVACVNGPEDTVLSGRVDIVEEARNKLKTLSVKCIVLNTPYAFHSAQVDPILADFEEAARSARFMTPRVPVLSPLLASVVKEHEVLTPNYVSRHAREAVNFSAALKAAQQDGLACKETVWLEVGPKPICLGMVKATLGDDCRTIYSLRQNENSWTSAAKALASLYECGHDINWNEYHRDFESGKNMLHIPTYSFEEKNYWIAYKDDWALRKGDDVSKQTSIAPQTQAAQITTTIHRLISRKQQGTTVSMVYETDLSDPLLYKVISGHKINGLALCPAGVYADMALTVADLFRKECAFEVPTTGINVTNMTILGPVTVPVPRVATPQLLQVIANAELESGNIHIEFKTQCPQTKNFTIPNAKCQAVYGSDQAWLHDWSRSAYLVRKRIEDLERGVATGTTNKMNKKMAYHLFSQLVDYSSAYQGMQEVLVDTEELEAAALVKFNESREIGDNFFASPLAVDNLAQLAGFVMNGIGAGDSSSGVYISHGWGSLRLSLPLDASRPYRVHVKMQPLEKSVMAGNVSIFQDQVMIGMIGDVMFQNVPRSLLSTMLSPHSSVGTRQSAASHKASKSPALGQKSEAAMPRQESPSAKALKRAEDTQANLILRVIAEEIGVDASELKDDSGFANLGVDSLLSLTIISKIREAVGIELPQSTFADCETVGDLKALLGDTGSATDTASESSLETPPESGIQTPYPVAETLSSPADNDMIEALHMTLAEQIGIDVEELVATDDLSALGVDSLMSLSIVAALREKMGINVPQDMLAENTSLKGIKAALDLVPSPSLPILSNPVPLRSEVRPHAATGSTRTAKSFLLQGNPQTASQTIFLFPDGSGSATSYRRLPEIAKGACVYAIDSPFLKHPTEYTCSLSEAALLMANEVRTRQSSGPYILAGWSAGGMYAYEAARHLISVGEIISKLILIDSPCRTDYGPMPQDVLDYVSRSGVIAGEGAATAAPEWLVQHFQSTIRAVQEYTPQAFDEENSPSTYVIWAARGVFEDWPQAELAGLDLTDAVAAWLLKPKTSPGANGWDKLLSAKKMKCSSVDGNHFNMVHPPNCASLSRAIAGAVGEDDAVEWTRA